MPILVQFVYGTLASFVVFWVQMVHCPYHPFMGPFTHDLEITHDLQQGENSRLASPKVLCQNRHPLDVT